MTTVVFHVLWVVCLFFLFGTLSISTCSYAVFDHSLELKKAPVAHNIYAFPVGEGLCAYTPYSLPSQLRTAPEQCLHSLLVSLNCRHHDRDMSARASK